MAVIIYSAAVIILLLISRRKGCIFVKRHGKYTSYILPAIVIPMKRILKKDCLGHGTLLMSLYGPGTSDDLLAAHWGMKVSSFILFSAFPIVYLTFADAGSAEILIASAFPFMGFFLPDMELKSKVSVKKKRIMADYPVFCTDMAVIAGAGMEVISAWKTAAGKKKNGELYKEARMAILRTETGMLFSDSLREFAAGLAVSEINTFVTIINQEIKAGSGKMDHKLSELAVLAWKEREDECREMGERAASKLVFPLAIGLAGILLILAAPAVIVMKGM